MDGRVMDDTAGRQSLSVAEIKNRKKKKKKKEKKLGGGMQVGRKWRRKGTRVERRRDAAERRQIYSSETEVWDNTSRRKIEKTKTYGWQRERGRSAAQWWDEYTAF